MDKVLKTKVFSSLVWKFLERGGTQGIQFILQLFLARLLTPKDYGTIALITIFISIAGVFIDSGFNTALIQQKDIDEEDISSVFYTSLAVSIIMYIILYFTASLIANFYKIQELIAIIRVLSITLIIGVFNSIQSAIVSRRMEFKKFFFSNLGAISISGTIGVILAYKGFGVWTLVYQQIINQIVTFIILYSTVKWRPKLLFSIKKIRKLFSYGSKLLCSALIDAIYRNMIGLIVGRAYSSTMLAYYNRGDTFPSLIVGNINGSIQAVIFPALASIQHDQKKVKELMRRAITTSSFIVFPAMLGLMAIAEPMIKLILTDKWLPCVPYLRVFCLSYALWPIHTANLQAINALGRSDIFLKLEILKKIVGVSILLVTSGYSPYMMALGVVFSGVISSFINSYPNKRLLNYGYLEQIKDILPSFLLSVIMGIITYNVILLKFSTLATIIIQIIIGGIIYIALSYLFKVESFIYLLNIILKKKRGKEL